MLAGRARAAFESGDHREALGSLDRLRALEPNARMPEEHLLYARTLEALGRVEEAEREYRGVITYYPGAEALARLATLLQSLGRTEDARDCWDKILSGAKIAPRFARTAQREWIEMARQNVG